MNRELPLVSIITPSYNQADFIEETILSVKDQDYSKLEHIIIDGGSTDRTVDILRYYEKKYNLRWVSEPDNGQSDAINKGFSIARGEIIGWVNSDDTYMPGAVSAAVEYLLSHPGQGWVYGDGYWIDENSQVLRIAKSRQFDLKAFICGKCSIVQPTVFFRRSALEVVGGLDLALHMTMDFDFFIRLGHKFEAGYIPRVLATRRLHSKAKSVDRSAEFCADGIATVDKFFSRAGIPMKILSSKRLIYGKRYHINGARCFKAGEKKAALRHLLHAMRLDPNIFQRQTIVSLILLFEILFGIEWYHPGESGIRRDQEQFRLVHGKVFTPWRKEGG